MARSIVKRFLVPVALATLTLGASGCPLLIASSVGSVGYEGYEYEKTGTLPGFPKMPTAAPSPSAGPPPSPASSAHDIE
jgi:hypothetical protein